MGVWTDCKGKKLKHWTTGDLKVLEESKHLTANEIAKKLGRSIASVEAARKRFGEQRSRLTTQQIAQQITELHSQGFVDKIIAAKVGVSLKTIYTYRAKLKLPSNGKKVRSGVFERRGKQLTATSRKGWSKEELEFIKTNYPKLSSKKIAAHLKRSNNSLQQLLLDLGMIEKDDCGARRTLFYYSNNENEYLLEIAKFRNKHGRPPTLIEGYRIAISLGWVKNNVESEKK